MSRPSTTFYFHKNMNKQETKVYETLTKLGRKKLDFTAWMINVVELTYNIDLDKLSKKELLALTKTPLPQQDQMFKMLNNLLAQRDISDIAAKNEQHKDVQINNITKTNKNNDMNHKSKKEIEKLDDSSITDSAIPDIQEDDDSLSDFQSGMLFDGLSGFDV